MANQLVCGITKAATASGSKTARHLGSSSELLLHLVDGDDEPYGMAWFP